MSVDNKKNESTTIAIPLCSKRKNGTLFVMMCSRVDTKEYIVVEEGLFIIGTRYMTKEQITKEYGEVLPKYFGYSE